MTTQKIIQQGAEAKIILKDKVVTKDRISKSYRHSELDKQIRKRRTKAETKLLKKASEIINTPTPTKSDESKIEMPFIDGKKLAEHLDKFPLEKQKQIMKQIGESIAKLHKEDIIHGDLTTSNPRSKTFQTLGSLIKRSKKILQKNKPRSRKNIRKNQSSRKTWKI
jgi:Kae1-associated kinase Bud32